jgi:hypothetical protein
MIAEEWIRERATVIDVTPEKELESLPSRVTPAE